MIESQIAGKIKSLIVGKVLLSFQKKKEILDTELWAIIDGLDIAKKLIQDNKNTPITITCNSWEALIKIQKVNSYICSLYMISLIHQKTYNLMQNNYPVTIC